MKVLVVEDEQRMSDLLLEVLPGMGYDALAARTAEQALKLLDQHKIDIVMLDLNLPVMGGMALLEKLREKHTHLPVIILTGYGSLDDARRAIRHDVTDFLTKPAHLGDIEAALDRARRRLSPPGKPDPRLAAADAPPPRADAAAAPAFEGPTSLAEIERRTILETLKRHKGNRTAAAAELGISRRTLYNKLSEYDEKG